MKKVTTSLLILAATVVAQAQTADGFESFTLAPNSAFSPSANATFQTNNAIFSYKWSSQFSFWSGGFAYTNMQDSINGTFTNLYGVRALKGYSNTANYAVGQDRAVIRLKAPYDKVEGFYITNTTYACKVVKSGNAFSRKFGDTTGTKSGTTIPQGSYPDFFKVTAKGYKNGTLKNDSAVFYLANYTFTNNTQDYVVDTWQWFNTSSLGSVDSIKFFMYSSDVGSFGINTPLFFAMDDFTCSAPNPVGLADRNSNTGFSAFPNPFADHLQIMLADNETSMQPVLRMYDAAGQLVKTVRVTETTFNLDVSQLEKGFYVVELESGDAVVRKRLIKQ